MRSTPLWRQGGRMRSTAVAADGSLSLPTARQQPPGAPSAQRTTSRPTTAAQSKGARRVRATHAHTGRPGMRIAGKPMGRGPMPVLPRGRPACPPGDGGHHSPHAGREGPRPQGYPNTRPQSPRERGRWARWGPRRRPSSARRAWRSRGPGGDQSGFCCCFLFLFLCVWRAWGEGD